MIVYSVRIVWDGEWIVKIQQIQRLISYLKIGEALK
jgi:hypothetical protein